MAYIISGKNGNGTYYTHSFNDRNETIELAKKFLTGNYSGTSRIVVQAKTGNILYQNIKDRDVQTGSVGLNTIKSGVKQQGLINRLKQNAMSKAAENQPKQKPIQKVQKKVQVKSEKVQTKNEKVQKKVQTKPKSNQCSEYVRLVSEQHIKMWRQSNSKVVPQIKAKLQTDKFSCLAFWCKKKDVKNYLFWTHTKIQVLGTAKFNTVLTEINGEEQRIIDIMQGILFISE